MSCHDNLIVVCGLLELGLVDADVEGEEEHQEAMARVSKHHREEEGEGDDGEDGCGGGVMVVMYW